MEGKFKTVDKAVAQVGFNPTNEDGFSLGGVFEIECLDKNGKLKWIEKVHNVVTNEGLDHLLNVQFHGASQISPWFVGLAGAGAKAVGDTLAAHAAWSEITDYTDSTARPDFVEIEATGQSISNVGNVAVFNIDGDATVAGAFICSVTTGDVGVLFCVSDFGSQRVVAQNDTMNVTYTLNASDA